MSGDHLEYADGRVTTPPDVAWSDGPEPAPSSEPRSETVGAHAQTASRLPTFLVIGAQRSGTTTIHHSLGRHPEIFVSPIKEVNFFLRDESGELPRWVDEATRRLVPETLDDYAALFAQARPEHRAVGESSPSYLHGPVAPRIKAQLPDARLVVILRQPVEQAFSIYTTWHAGGVPGEELIDRFVAALACEDPGPGGALPLARHGCYHRHLAPYFEHFDRRQIKVTLFDDLKRDPAGYFADLFRFLGVDDGFRLDAVERMNGSGEARNAAVHWLLSKGAAIKGLARATLPDNAVRSLTRLQHRLRSANLRETPGLSPELCRQLTRRYYRDDILALEKLIDRDLGLWGA